MNDGFEQIRVRDLVFFDRLAVLGTITATARELGIPKPTASRWLAMLESHVGHSLVRRTTRHAALTERGRAFHERVREVLVTMRAAQQTVQAAEPGGTLRVSVPVPLGRLLGGRTIADFRARMPGVRLEIALQNHRVDLVRDRFDLAIRGGALPDSELLARRLASVPLWLYASVGRSDEEPDSRTVIAVPGDEGLLRTCRPPLPSPAVLIDDRSAVAEALVAGAGIGILPAFLGEPHRREGRLVRLGAQPLTHTPVHALYLPAQRDDVRLRVLIEGIEAELHRTVALNDPSAE